MQIKLPRLVRIIGEGNVPTNEMALARALVGCELHPDHGIFYPSRRKPTWLVFGVKVDDLKKRYPEIFQRFRKIIQISWGDTLAFGGSECEIIR